MRLSALTKIRHSWSGLLLGYRIETQLAKDNKNHNWYVSAMKRCTLPLVGICGFRQKHFKTLGNKLIKEKPGDCECRVSIVCIE